jgi:hypothetical protein
MGRVAKAELFSLDAHARALQPFPPCVPVHIHAATFNGLTVKTTVTLPDVPGALEASGISSHHLFQLSCCLSSQ